MFYDYLCKFDLSVFESIFIMVDNRFGKSILNFFTLDFDYLFDLHDLFNNLDIISISHIICDEGSSLVLKVIINE